MARRKSRTLTELELELMKVLWARKEASTDDLQGALCAAGRELADGSVRTMLRILARKGYVARRREGRAFLYKATVGEQQAHRSFLRDLVSRAFGGSAALLVAALLNDGAVRDEDLETIKRLIADREEQGHQAK